MMPRTLPDGIGTSTITWPSLPTWKPGIGTAQAARCVILAVFGSIATMPSTQLVGTGKSPITWTSLSSWKTDISIEQAASSAVHIACALPKKLPTYYDRRSHAYLADCLSERTAKNHNHVVPVAGHEQRYPARLLICEVIHLYSLLLHNAKGATMTTTTPNR